MAITQTAWNPLPHRHNVDDVMGLGKQLYGEEGRSEPPFCEILYTTNFLLADNTNTPMGGGFATVKDNAFMVYHPGSGGGQSDKLRVRIPITGMYEVTWQYFIDGVGTLPVTAAITKNGSSVTSNSVGVAQGASNGWAAPNATVIRSFDAGDFLYFFAWQNSGAPKWVSGYWFGDCRTRITARYLGPK